MRLDRLAVERDQARPVTVELETEDAGVRGVDQAQPQALAGAHRKNLGDPPVHRDGVADPAVVARVHEAAEIAADLGIGQEAPVVEHPGDVAVDPDRLPLLDDQRAVQAAPDLLEAALVRVVPVGPGIGQVERVDEGRAGRDRGLGEMRHAVHGIGHPQPMPVHGGLLLEPVLDHDPQALALTHPDLGARHRAVVRPDGGLRVSAPDEGRAAEPRDQTIARARVSPAGPGRQRRCRRRCAAAHQERTTRECWSKGDLHGGPLTFEMAEDGRARARPGETYASDPQAETVAPVPAGRIRRQPGVRSFGGP